MRSRCTSAGSGCTKDFTSKTQTITKSPSLRGCGGEETRPLALALSGCHSMKFNTNDQKSYNVMFYLLYCTIFYNAILIDIVGGAIVFFSFLFFRCAVIFLRLSGEKKTGMFFWEFDMFSLIFLQDPHYFRPGFGIGWGNEDFLIGESLWKMALISNLTTLCSCWFASGNY